MKKLICWETAAVLLVVGVIVLVRSLGGSSGDAAIVTIFVLTLVIAPLSLLPSAIKQASQHRQRETNRQHEAKNSA